MKKKYINRSGFSIKTDLGHKLSSTLSGEYQRPHAPEFIQKIDWKLLREQKLDMLHIITDIEENSQYANNDEEEENYKRWKNSLEGIIHLIDAIQDYATDEMGLSDKEVFNLEEDEKS